MESNKIEMRVDSVAPCEVDKTGGDKIPVTSSSSSSSFFFASFSQPDSRCGTMALNYSYVYGLKWRKK